MSPMSQRGVSGAGVGGVEGRRMNGLRPIGIAILAAALGCGGAAAMLPAAASGTGRCPGGWRTELLARMNDARAAAGVPPVREQPQLMAAAAARSREMASRGWLSHDGWKDAIRGSGYGGRAIAENIALGPPNASELTRAWMESPRHRAIMLREYHRDVGLGCAADERGHLWWTADFGGLSPATPAPAGTSGGAESNALVGPLAAKVAGWPIVAHHHGPGRAGARVEG